LFETNKENISFSVQNETCTNTKKPTNTIQINVKQQSNYGPNNSPNYMLENNKPKHMLANNSKEPEHMLRHSVQIQKNQSEELYKVDQHQQKTRCLLREAKEQREKAKEQKLSSPEL
ncbi:5501_t:CDS:2, partial [Cetraspora pellucida]